MYLGQLPQQSQALLMREFERAIERGQDVAVATLVLQQLRMVVRAPDEEVEEETQAPPPARTEDVARILFQPLEPFLVDGNVPMRPGQIRRTSLMAVWQWLIRDGAPDQVYEFEKSLSGSPADAAPPEAAVRKLQLAVAEAIFQVTSPSGGANQRALARIGAPNVIEDLLPIGSVLQVREALDSLGSRLPLSIRNFADSQIESDPCEALNIPTLQTPQLLPFALSLLTQRLTAPWQIIRIAIRIAASDDELRVAATPYGMGRHHRHARPVLPRRDAAHRHQARPVRQCFR